MRFPVKAGLALAAASAAPFTAIAIGSPYIALRGSLAFSDESKTRVSGVPLRMSYDTGWGASAAVGNEYGPIHLELEGVYRRFQPNRIVSGTTSTRASGDVDLIAPMVNVLVDVPFDRFMPYSVRPYVGAGVGAVYADLQPRGTGITLRDDQSWGFGYQLMAGLSIPVMNNVTMRLGYRYLAAPNMRFHAAGGAAFKTDVAVHSVDLGLDLRF
jgi:opacity protein-like surface antigen